MKRRLFFRVIASLLAFVIFLEPISVRMLYAAEEEKLPEPTKIEYDKLMELDEIYEPHEYLDAMLAIRGKNRNEVELRAWGEWQNFINNSYLVIDEGATDVFGLYDALKIAKDVKSTICDVGSTIGKITKYAHMTTTFLEKISEKLSRKRVAFRCWIRLNKWTKKIYDLAKNNKLLDALSFCSAPNKWHDAKNASRGMDAYWHWLKRDGTSPLTKAQGIARTVGIGFSIIGTALAAWNVAKNEDRKVGRLSYNLVKDCANLALAIAGLIAMFCNPVGWAVAVVTAIWGILTSVGDLFGEYNKRWKDAYKNSYWFLYQNDPEFKSYYDNREYLTKDEKSAAYSLLEDKYSEFKTDKAIEDSDKLEGDEKIKARNGRIYIALEKQGVLTSYYNRKPFSLSSYSMSKLLELWEMKADYMSWKPTEVEANTKKSFWDKVGDVFNPKTYISWVGDKIQSHDYKKFIKNNNIEKVYFNPDFVLLRKYQTWITANRLMVDDEENQKTEKELDSGFYRMIGLRLEQSPFNYIPLVGIEMSAWNPELFKEALFADSFIVQQKELVAVHNQIEIAVKDMEDAIDKQDDFVKEADKKQLPHSKKVREFLFDFAKAYADNPDKEDSKLFKRAKKLMDVDLSKCKNKSPREMLAVMKEDLEKALLYEPLSMSQKGAEVVLLTLTIKQYLDMGVLMTTYLKEKKDSLKSIDSDITNEDIKMYIKEGTFLSVKGKTFLDWLGDQYPVYEETEKVLKQIEKDATEYNKQAGVSASNERTGFLWIKKNITTPPELLEKINDELEAWKETIEAWEEISDNADVRVVLAENKDFKEKLLSRYEVIKSEFTPLEPLDPDNEKIAEVEITYEETDSTALEGAANALLDN